MLVCMVPSSPPVKRTLHLIKPPDILLANDSRQAVSNLSSNSRRLWMKTALRAAFPTSAAPCRCSLPGCRPDLPAVRRRLCAGSAPVSGLDGFCRGDATPPVRPYAQRSAAAIKLPPRSNSGHPPPETRRPLCTEGPSCRSEERCCWARTYAHIRRTSRAQITAPKACDTRRTIDKKQRRGRREERAIDTRAARL